MITRCKEIFLKGVTVSLLLFPFFSAYAATTAPKVDSTPVSVGSILQIFFWLLIVVSTIIVLTWLLKKFSGMNSNLSGTIKLVAGIHVGQREKIALVQVGDKQILVGITASTITKLHVLENSIEVSSTPMKPAETFADKLKQAIQMGKR